MGKYDETERSWHTAIQKDKKAKKANLNEELHQKRGQVLLSFPGDFSKVAAWCQRINLHRFFGFY
jgi:hypothetical protein